MKPLFALLALLCVAHATSPVVRPAPDFAFDGPSAKHSLRGLRGQPVVLLIARSPKDSAFRKQLKALASIYAEYASRGTLFVAAFSEQPGEVPSNIPFIVAKNGAQVASDYGQREDLVVAIIGRDGNLDYATHQALPAFRIREVLQNNYDVQTASRRVIPIPTPDHHSATPAP